MAVAAPADKRFRRAQVKPARRRRLWTGVRWHVARNIVIAAAFGYATFRVAHVATSATALQINRIVVRGNQRLSTGEVLTVLEGLRGQNILTADLAYWQKRLLVSPWVGHAALRRILPSTIEVFIDERAPMGIGRMGTQLFLVDEDGVIIDEYGPQYSQFDLPIIDGLASLGKDADASTEEDRAHLAAGLLDALGRRKDILRRISQIDVRDTQDAIVILEGDPTLVHVGDEAFLERLESYVELAPALRARVPRMDYVDLRFDARVYVRPADDGGQAGARPAPSGRRAPS